MEAKVKANIQVSDLNTSTDKDCILSDRNGFGKWVQRQCWTIVIFKSLWNIPTELSNNRQDTQVLDLFLPRLAKQISLFSTFVAFNHCPLLYLLHYKVTMVIKIFYISAKETLNKVQCMIRMPNNSLLRRIDAEGYSWDIFKEIFPSRCIKRAKNIYNHLFLS